MMTKIKIHAYKLSLYGLSLSAAVTAFASPVWAAVASAEGAEMHESQAGLPQFNPDSFASQLFWLAVSFAVLYVIFASKTLPSISRVLENRQETLSNNLTSAEEMRQEAENVRKGFEETLSAAHQEARKISSDLHDQAKKDAAQQAAAFQDYSQKQIKQSEEALDKNKQDILKGLDKVSAEVASLALKKIADVKISEKDLLSSMKTLEKKKKAA